MADQIVDSSLSATVVLASGDDLIVMPDGSIGTFNASAIQLTGSNHKVVVAGTVIAISAAVASGTSVASLEFQITTTGQAVSSFNADTFNADVSSELYFSNAGIIEGFDGIEFEASDAGANLFVANSGIITGRDDGVSLGSGANNAMLINSGTINAIDIGFEISADGIGIARLINSGVINAGNNAVQNLHNQVVRIDNTGEMTGNLLMGSGADSYNGRWGLLNGTASMGDGNDVFRGGAEANYADGGADNDMLYGYGGDDTLLGNSGFDTLLGGRGNDSLDGGGRTDRLAGGLGDDTLTGGGGGDVFVIRRTGNGDDEVTDFQNNSDVVDISALGVQNFNQLNNTFNAFSQTTDGVLVDLAAAGGSGSILLVGVTGADMDASDFIF